MEEFGYPRDGFAFSKKAPTTARDAYYSYVFSLLIADAAQKGYFAGCNFWDGAVKRDLNTNNGNLVMTIQVIPHKKHKG